MKRIIKKNKGITLVSLVVTVIVLIILAGVSINLVLGENGILTMAKKAKENTELAQIKEQEELNVLYEYLEQEGGIGGDMSYDAIAKLNDFKKKIADYIEEAGGIKPEYTADAETFGQRIKGIVKEVTKNATATADNITEGKTAWVNGELVTGNGKDNKNSYEQGSQQSSKLTKVELGTVNGIYSSQTKTFNCTNIPNYKNLTNDNFTYTIGGTSYLYWKTYEQNTSAEKNVALSGATMSYNSETGILTITMGGANYHNSTQVFSGVYLGFTFYCIY